MVIGLHDRKSVPPSIDIFAAEGAPFVSHDYDDETQVVIALTLAAF